MKKPITKDQIRRRLEHQTKAFVDAGGEINAIEPGLSGICLLYTSDAADE